MTRQREPIPDQEWIFWLEGYFWDWRKCDFGTAAGVARWAGVSETLIRRWRKERGEMYREAAMSQAIRMKLEPGLDRSAAVLALPRTPIESKNADAIEGDLVRPSKSAPWISEWDVAVGKGAADPTVGGYDFVKIEGTPESFAEKLASARLQLHPDYQKQEPRELAIAKARTEAFAKARTKFYETEGAFAYRLWLMKRGPKSKL